MELQVNNDNARNAEQLRCHEQIIKDGVCPFCPENLEKYHTPPILKRGKHWVVTDNQWPYDHTQNHVIFIAVKHITNLPEVSAAAFAELGELAQWVLKTRKIDFGGFAMRFGDITKNGATVSHLHCHIIQPDYPLPKGVKVKFKISG